MNPSRRPKQILLLSLAIVILVADQLVKLWVTRSLPYGVTVPVLPPLVYWFHTVNTGVAWSLFPGHTSLFSGVAIVFVIGILVLGRSAMQRSLMLTIALGLLLGGSVGNLVDRLRFQYVVDFIDVHLGHWYRWPTFNVADSAITVGMVLLAIYFLFEDNSVAPAGPVSDTLPIDTLTEAGEGIGTYAPISAGGSSAAEPVESGLEGTGAPGVETDKTPVR